MRGGGQRQTLLALFVCNPMRNDMTDLFNTAAVTTFYILAAIAITFIVNLLPFGQHSEFATILALLALIVAVSNRKWTVANQ